jgi:CDGSH-type Zn-finger protein
MKPTIKPLKNGPLQVKHLEKCVNSKGEQLKAPPSLLLCRCGKSKNKPYCDGTHTKIGFSDAKDPGRIPDEIDDYPGKKITIHDNRGVCAHRKHCIHYGPEVFRMRHKPWIFPDAQNAEDSIRVIKMCPSGALSYTQDGVLHKNWDQEPAILVSKNGPYDVQGYIGLNDPDGNQPESKEHYTLCRCGHSKNKPFCDGRHARVGFNDPRN